MAVAAEPLSPLAQRLMELYSPNDAALELGLSPQTVKNLWKAGRLTGYSTANGLLLDPDSVAQEKARRQAQAG